MFSTGARVPEIVALCVGDLRLDTPAQVRLHGKGRKESALCGPRPPTCSAPCWPNADANCTRAQATVPVRHGHAVHLLRAGVDIVILHHTCQGGWLPLKSSLGRP